ncbi:MAG: SpoIID/LytB domain-containing protein [Acidimicrobiales bacterium]
MRSRLLVSGAAIAVAGTALHPTPVAAAVAVVVIDGRGFGHGVGMAQDGALAMGRQGASVNQILAQFYPGTRMAKSAGEVRVVVAGPAGGPVSVVFPAGGQVRDARAGDQSPGFPVTVPAGGQVRIGFDGSRYRLEPLAAARPAAAGPVVEAASPATATTTTTTTTTTTVETTTTTSPPLLNLPALLAPGQPLLPQLLPLPPPAPPSATAPPPPAAAGGGPTMLSSTRPLWVVPAGGGTIEVPARGQRYRGAIEATAAGSPLRLVNHVDVEQYLRGMGEVRDPNWPQASLRAQAVAARTYALRAVGGGGELCDTQRCQVYLGAAAEYTAMDKAVAATRGQVLTFGRGLASTVYSANGGGVSATPEEGFGTPGASYPYLRAAPYPSVEPLAWTVRVSMREVGRRLGYRGAVEGIRATALGASGRVVQVTLDGARGTRTVSGIDFDRALGLRSTLFTLRTEVADSAPPPPPAAEGPVQLLPEQAGGQSAAPAEITGVAAPSVEAPAPIALRPGAVAADAAVELAAAADGTAPTSAKLALSVVAWLGLLAVGVALWLRRAVARR